LGADRSCPAWTGGILPDRNAMTYCMTSRADNLGMYLDYPPAELKTESREPDMEPRLS
jgi:hypothetical protein